MNISKRRKRNADIVWVNRAMFAWAYLYTKHKIDEIIKKTHAKTFRFYFLFFFCYITLYANWLKCFTFDLTVYIWFEKCLLAIPNTGSGCSTIFRVENRNKVTENLLVCAVNRKIEKSLCYRKRKNIFSSIKNRNELKWLNW